MKPSIESLGEAIDRVLDAARKRMAEASEGAKALIPSELDWATSEELAEIHRLQLQIPRYERSAKAARERVKAKREARRQASKL